eukprot:m.139512 g.139512  ORF g.139512 m.139512 type:complete len:599 (-) comp9994_c0_seq1:95-1891(-)
MAPARGCRLLLLAALVGAVLAQSPQLEIIGGSIVVTVAPGEHMLVRYYDQSGQPEEAMHTVMLDTDRDALLATIDALVLRVAANERDIAASKTDVSALRTDLTAVNVTTSTLSVNVGGLQTDVSDLQGTTGTLSTEVSTLKTDVSDLQATTDTLSTDVGTLQTDVSDLQGTTDTLSTDVGTLQTDVSSLESTTDTLSNNVGTLQTDVSDLQGTTDSLSTTVSTLETDVSDLQGTTDTLSTDVSTLQTDVNTLETDLTSANSATTALTTTVSNLSEQLGNLQTTVNNLGVSELAARVSALEATPAVDWPATATFSSGVEGWVGVQRTDCRGNWLLGGHNAWDVGVEVSRTYNNLPPHTALRIRMDIFFMDSWDNEEAIIKVDGVEVWRQARTWGSNKFDLCGSELYEDYWGAVDLVIAHKGPTLKISITTTQNSDGDNESFAIDNVEVLNYDFQWPATDRFQSSNDGWSGSTSECGGIRMIGGFNIFGQGASTSKTFQLPFHTAVRIEFDFIFIDSWDSEDAIAKVDGIEIWRERNTVNPLSNQVCGSTNSGWNEKMTHVSKIVSHVGTTLTLSFTSTLNSDPNDESWGVTNIRVAPAF